MSDSIVKDTQKLAEKIVEDSKVQLKNLRKVKAMTKLAHDMGEDTASADNLISVAESVLKDFIGKLNVKK